MSTDQSTSARVLAFGRRWLIAYLVGYMLPFPLGHIPGLDSWVHEAAGPWRALLAWAGQALFGVEAVSRFSGSGDTMYHHIELLCLATLATLVAVAWSVLARGAPVSSRVIDRAWAYARLYLGSQLLIYGWSKLIPNQFPVPGPDRLIVPYGDSSPMGLLWAFMGASTAYQVLAGLAEVAAGLLLFWRRSAPSGALLAALVLANVVALNYCYDVPVKLFASHLLILAIVILAPDLRRLIDVLVCNRPAPPRVLDPHPITSRATRAWIVVGKLLLIALMSSGSLIEALLMTRDGAAARALHGVYEVESFLRNEDGGPLPDAQRWSRVGISDSPGRGAILWANGSGERFRLTLDEQERALRWTRLAEQDGALLHYRVLDDGGLKLWGKFDEQRITVVLRRVDTSSLLLSRGFRWVQERPFNR
jgi:uncharacterized membrane protein YphA (DoxX/SURF4 family)